MTFAGKLQALRKQHGWTQEELAEKLITWLFILCVIVFAIGVAVIIYPKLRGKK